MTIDGERREDASIWLTAKSGRDSRLKWVLTVTGRPTQPSMLRAGETKRHLQTTPEQVLGSKRSAVLAHQRQVQRLRSGCG